MVHLSFNYKHVLLTRMAIPLPLGRSFYSEFHVTQDGFKYSSSTPNINFSRKSISLFPSNDKISNTTRSNTNKRIRFSKEEGYQEKRPNQCFQTSRTQGSICRELFSPVFYASESDSTDKHKSSVEIYMEKLQNQAKQVSGSDSVSEMDDQSSQVLARKELGLLEEYLNTLREDVESEECLNSSSERNASGKFRVSSIIRKKGNIYARKAASSTMYDEKESANLYLISTLLSTNIAVFLFEIASPVKGSDYNLDTLPMMYGAKVNDLIMVGEWWRLVTPMFLHSGLLHIVLSSWVLLSFGPQVCKRYGLFTFLLIFILGGISGNFSSFLHTSEPTVGGSGPIFAVIGAWLVYHTQNKDVVPKELSDSMFQKTIIATALSFLLANFGPMDNWTSLGAAVSGIIYGFLTCPVAQVDDGSASASQERNDGMKEEITLNSTQAANPCKSLAIFTIFVSALSSLLFLVESPLDNLEIEELVRIIE